MPRALTQGARVSCSSELKVVKLHIHAMPATTSETPTPQLGSRAAPTVPAP